MNASSARTRENADEPVVDTVRDGRSESSDENSSDKEGIPHASTADDQAARDDAHAWTTHLASVMSRTREELGSRLHTTLSCSLRKERPVLFLPPEMASLQPRSLGYLRAFARRHGFGLIEDRRKTDIQPLLEQRNQTPPALALGISLMLQQTGMPGGARTLSTPHRIASDSMPIELDELVRIAARVRKKSKRVVLLPNRMIVEATGQNTHPIVARGCKVETAEATTILTQYESPAFRAIGYSTGLQYVVHVFLAGGLAGDPGLWTRLHTLTHTNFRFRLFPGERPALDFGLLHTTFCFDVPDGDESPWWLSSDSGSMSATPLPDALRHF